MNTAFGVVDCVKKTLRVIDNKKVIAEYAITSQTSAEDIEFCRTYREDESFDWAI